MVNRQHGPAVPGKQGSTNSGPVMSVVVSGDQEIVDVIGNLAFRFQAVVQIQRRTTLALSTTLVEAARALQDQFGVRLEADHHAGRRSMADALGDRFSISARDARHLVAALESSRTIRYHPRSVRVWPSVQYNAYWQL